MKDLAHDLVQALKAGGATVSFAESCTGGLFASTLTEISGASEVFRSSFVVYSDAEKQRLLQVPSTLISQHGAVSEACVLSMLQGIQRHHPGCYGAAVSGIAGPGGARPGKPVGTVCIAIGSPEGRFGRRFLFSGDRRSVREQTVRAGLQGLLRLISGEEAPW